MIARSRSFLGSVLYATGLAAIYLGERILGAGQGRWVFTLAGLALVVLSVAVRAVRVASAGGARRRVEALLLGLQLLGVASLVFYFVQSDVWMVFGGQRLSDSSPRDVVLGDGSRSGS